MALALPVVGWGPARLQNGAFQESKGRSRVRALKGGGAQGPRERQSSVIVGRLGDEPEVRGRDLPLRPVKRRRGFYQAVTVADAACRAARRPSSTPTVT